MMSLASLLSLSILAGRVAFAQCGPDGQTPSHTCPCGPPVCGACAPCGSDDGGGGVGAQPAPGSRTGSGGGGSAAPAFTPMQQMQMGMALGAEQAVVNAFVGWLLSPAPKRGPTAEEIKAQQLERQRQAALQARLEEERRLEKERRERERAKYIEAHGELMQNAKDVTGDAQLQFKAIRYQPTLAGLQNNVRAIDCAMDDAYAAASALGPEGKAFADSIRKDVFENEKTLADGKSFQLHWDSMNGGLKTGRQMVADLLVSRLEDGGTRMQLMYTASENGGKPTEGQSVVMLDRLGLTDCQEATGSAAKCMRSFNPKSKKSYCPKEPPVEQPEQLKPKEIQ